MGEEYSTSAPVREADSRAPARSGAAAGEEKLVSSRCGGNTSLSSPSRRYPGIGHDRTDI